MLIRSAKTGDFGSALAARSAFALEMDIIGYRNVHFVQRGKGRGVHYTLA
jgi:hypothetical protein